MSTVINYTTNYGNCCSYTKSFSWDWNCCNDWHIGGRPMLFKYGCCDGNMGFGKSFLAGLGGGLGWGLGNMLGGFGGFGGWFGGGMCYPMSSCMWMC